MTGGAHSAGRRAQSGGANALRSALCALRSLSPYDLAYAAALTATAPAWAARPASRDKVLLAVGRRMGHVRRRDGDGPAVLIHAVSLGEVNATAALVAQLRHARPDVAVIVSATTEVGYARGRQLYADAPGVRVVRFPLDFSVAVNHLLDAVRPTVAVLMEGEIWPNFLLHCQRRGIPVLLVNGRVSDRAFARYKRFRRVTATMIRRLTLLCAQDQTIADRFAALGMPPDRLRATGTMKFDTADLADRVDGDAVVAAAVGLRPGDPVWICGSTGPGEEPLLLDVYADLLKRHPTLQLVIVPRKPERFDAVADGIAARGFAVVRRSGKAATPGRSPAVVLGDTMGELRLFYSLGTVVFVGRSLVDLGSSQHGSDMIEPAALAKPVAVGPWTRNFAEPVRQFKAADAMVEVPDGRTLAATLSTWLADPAAAVALGRRAQAVVRDGRGATARHIEVILDALPPRRSEEALGVHPGLHLDRTV